MKPRTPTTPGEWLFVVLTRCYPRRFRDRYAADLLDAFRQDRSRPQFRGASGACRFWWLTLRDMARTSASERRVPNQTSGAGSRGSRTVWLGDFRQGIRGLRKQPAFALIAMLTLGVGVGATTTIFAIVDRTLLSPLPYPEADRLVRVYERERENPGARMVAYGNYADLRSQADVFEELAIWAYNAQALTGVTPARELRVRETSANFPRVFRTPPALGRWFSRDEEMSGQAVVVLSHGLWQDAFGGAEAVTSQALLLDGRSHRILGVMPAGFDFPSLADLWLPLEPIRDPVGQRSRHRHNMVGRLKAGVTAAAAREQTDAIAARLEADFPDLNHGNYFAVHELLDDVVGTRASSLVALLGAVAALWLTACVNIAALALARSVARGRELAVRAALGASRWRLGSLVLAESLILAAAGSVVGLAMAGFALPWLVDLAGSAIPRADEIGALTGRAFGFASLVSLVSAVIIAAVPVIRVCLPRVAQVATLVHGARQSASRGVVRGRRVLVAAQLALAFMLAAGAGVLIASAGRLHAVETGVVADSVLTMRIQLPGASYPEPEDTARATDDLMTTLEALPGVVSAAVTLTPPVDDTGWYNLLTIRDRPLANPRRDAPPISYVVASSGYFETLQVPVLAGRTFESGEPRGEPVAVVNRAAVERYWPDESPIGKYILGSNNGAPWVRIIGVVDDIRTTLLAPPEPQVFVPVAQDRVLGFVIAIRTTTDPLEATAMVRDAIEATDPNVPITSIMTLADRIGLATTGVRLNAGLMSIFALLAVLLAAVGVFGVVSYSVADRRREFGIRIAIGASRARVLGQVLRECGALVLVAVGIGAAGSWYAGSLLQGLLFEVRATEPSVLITVAAILGTVAIAAAIWPARTAASADPLVVLQTD